MLEPTDTPTGSSDQETNNVQFMVIAERNKAIADIQADVEYISSAHKMLAKIAQEQGQQLDKSFAVIDTSSELTEAANRALLDCEKSTNQRRKRNIIAGVVGTITCAAVVVTVLSTLRFQRTI